jgi:UDP-perosamine 4-acetyltransferase
MTRLILIGGGDHARVVADSVRRTSGVTILGYLDNERSSLADAMGLSYLGDDSAFLRQYRDTEEAERPSLFIAVGNAAANLRREIVGRFAIAHATWATLADPTSAISEYAVLGQGVFVGAHAVISAGATVGDHAIINTGSVVEHDSVIGAFAHIAPGAILGGGVEIGEDTLVGLGAAVRDHVRVGANTIVGMGAAVVSDVPPGSIVAGVPARIISARPMDTR